MELKTIKIGGYNINSDDVWMYIQHFGKDKSNLNAWEKMRRSLHNYIFENLNIDRNSDEGIKFGKKFDAWAEQHIMKYDPISAKAKQLSRANSDKEAKVAQTMIQIEMARQEKMNEIGARNFTVTDKNKCRICKKDLIEGIPRYNDHLIGIPGFKQINAPICMDCAKSRPDDYHIAFKKTF